MWNIDTISNLSSILKIVKGVGFGDVGRYRHIFLSAFWDFVDRVTSDIEMQMCDSDLYIEYVANTM